MKIYNLLKILQLYASQKSKINIILTENCNRWKNNNVYYWDSVINEGDNLFVVKYIFNFNKTYNSVQANLGLMTSL